MLSLRREPAVCDCAELLIRKRDELVQRRQCLQRRIGLRVLFQRDSSLARVKGPASAGSNITRNSEARMSRLRFTYVGGLVLVAVTFACSGDVGTVSPRIDESHANGPSHTMGVGSVSTPFGRATFADPSDPNFKIKRITGDWHVEVKAKGALDIAVQSIVFMPGGYSGWHRHPGPVFIQVVEGEMTFYESDDPTCTPIRRKKGEGYLDKGEHAHFARNETATQAENIVTYLAPPGASLRIDEPNPGNCPF